MRRRGNRPEEAESSEGGGYYCGRGAGWGGPHDAGGLLGLVLIILLILWLTDNIAGGLLVGGKKGSSRLPPQA
jgi:hypothetical protein